ncbi:hypothetical protein USDA257_c55220 [Sinorhizobium fredii USDA 257]|uniref:Uncharacterized protein n=1 Tax=Sinorhizobium fredii (strain USDA 257) TaxID=1185652 RepID=I3XDT1_SINF2|nr:hypothetical protein USDA257_c55220 [Sinorhizobium fredii USDA 257]
MFAEGRQLKREVFNVLQAFRGTSRGDPANQAVAEAPPAFPSA